MLVRVPNVDDLSGQTSAGIDPLRVRREVDRLRERIVEVKLYALRKGLAHIELQRVIAGIAVRSPRVQGRELRAQERIWRLRTRVRFAGANALVEDSRIVKILDAALIQSLDRGGLSYCADKRTVQVVNGLSRA